MNVVILIMSKNSVRIGTEKEANNREIAELHGIASAHARSIGVRN